MGQLVGASAHGQALAVAWRCEVVAQFGQVGVGQGQLLRRLLWRRCTVLPAWERGQQKVVGCNTRETGTPRPWPSRP